MPIFRACGADGRCHDVIRDQGAGEAGTVWISASVGDGAHNRFEDVRTIQDALNQVPPMEGGPTERLAVDGICGYKTLCAIRRFQKVGCGFQWPDGRIDPGRRTHQRLQAFFLEPNPYSMELIQLELPAAAFWVNAALEALAQARVALASGQPSSRLDLVNHYFHLDQLSQPEALAALDSMEQLYRLMEKVIAESTWLPGSGYFVEDPKENRHYAYSYQGGYHAGPVPAAQAGYSGPDVPINRIYICPRKLNAHALSYYNLVVIHEMAHFCGGRRGSAGAIEDFGYRRDGDSFFHLTPAHALHTADCYAHFAAQAATGLPVPVPELQTAAPSAAPRLSRFRVR